MPQSNSIRGGSKRNKMYTGRVLKVIDSKGYGFISCNENGLEYFFHFSMLTRIPKVGELVKFEVSDRADRGPRCKSVEFENATRS